jgi:hypothetical protein
VKRSSAATCPVSAINERHIPRIDKLFRMFAGASSTLLELGETSFLVEIEIDHRVTEESAPQLVWNIAQSWRRGNPELSQCTKCVVHLRRSPGPTGFMLPASGSQTDGDADAGMDPRGIAARIREIESASDLPTPLIARYLLSFDPVETIVRAPGWIPDLAGN